MLNSGIPYTAWPVPLGYITVTSQWVVKSPESRSFVQSFIQAQIKENFKAPRHWLLWGESISDRLMTSSYIMSECAEMSQYCVHVVDHRLGNDCGMSARSGQICGQGHTMAWGILTAVGCLVNCHHALKQKCHFDKFTSLTAPEFFILIIPDAASGDNAVNMIFWFQRHTTQCHYDVKTTSRRRFDAIMALLLRREWKKMLTWFPMQPMTKIWSICRR